MSSPTRFGVALGIAVLSIAMIALYLFVSTEVAPTSAADLSVPSLFAEPARCGLSGSDAALRAEQAEHDARARWERVPYAAEEAPLAVHTLEEAAACFRVSGERSGRARVERDLFAWQHEMARIFRRARLRLELSVRAARHEEVMSEARTLRAMLVKAGSAADAYRAYLTGVERSSRAARMEEQRQVEEEE